MIKCKHIERKGGERHEGVTGRISVPYAGGTKGDYAAFLESYNNESVRGLRANTLKGNAGAIAALCPVKLERVDNTADGFRLMEAWEGVGLSPVHMAGLIYMQEPSAMLTIAIADIHPGMKVLDMCAAPAAKREPRRQG